MWRIRQAERAVRGKKVWFHGRGRERERSTRAACGAYGSPRARYATSVAMALRAAEEMGMMIAASTVSRMRWRVEEVAAGWSFSTRRVSCERGEERG